MKRFLFSLLCFLLLVSLISCSGKGKGVDTDSQDTDAPQTETENTKREVGEIYGMFDEQYQFIFDDICYIADTFTVNDSVFALINEYEASFSIDNIDTFSARVPAIYYLIDKLDVSNDDISAYFEAAYASGANTEKPSDKQLSALGSGDVSEIMKVCVHPSALAKDGRVFTLRMLLEGDAGSYGVNDDEIKETVNRAISYYGENKLLKSPSLTDNMKNKLISLGFKIEKESISSICPVHTDAYHTIPEYFYAAHGESEIDKWKEDASSAENDTECTMSGVNIKAFLIDFGYSKEAVIEIYNSFGGTLGDLNIDLIYSDDAEAADAYYRTKNEAMEKAIAYDRAIASLKERIIADKEMGDFFTNVHEVSLPEILFMFDEDEAYLSSLSDFMVSLGLENLNLSAFYQNYDEILRLIMRRSAYYVDCYVTGRTAYDTPYEARK
ncbi:MAG: hypothetical protein IKT56_03170 [Clostridia bacterium]|nr:hypothetical protein [Clostridia bacterium]